MVPGIRPADENASCLQQRATGQSGRRLPQQPATLVTERRRARCASSRRQVGLAAPWHVTSVARRTGGSGSLISGLGLRIARRYAGGPSDEETGYVRAP